jgi:hypothetical protein
MIPSLLMMLKGLQFFGVAFWIASLLYGKTVTDPATFAGMILLLGAVASLQDIFQYGADRTSIS